MFATILFSELSTSTRSTCIWCWNTLVLSHRMCAPTRTSLGSSSAPKHDETYNLD